jgi:hypothetical protein
MGIATDILALRHRHFSSVIVLCAALERVHDAPEEKRSARAFLAMETADLVLANVAAHAAEAMLENPKIAKTRRAGVLSRRRSRRFDARPSSQQRALFAS